MEGHKRARPAFEFLVVCGITEDAMLSYYYRAHDEELASRVLGWVSEPLPPWKPLKNEREFIDFQHEHACLVMHTSAPTKRAVLHTRESDGMW
jgi:hypothetical protein